MTLQKHRELPIRSINDEIDFVVEVLTKEERSKIKKREVTDKKVHMVFKESDHSLEVLPSMVNDSHLVQEVDLLRSKKYSVQMLTDMQAFSLDLIRNTIKTLDLDFRSSRRKSNDGFDYEKVVCYNNTLMKSTLLVERSEENGTNSTWMCEVECQQRNH
ncbi:hypothetical protein GOP47_0026801 [Adiantum capillus-veneris]|nr:hypothetical protein GOP47_0026801 [Adiantum capillus-veneris]